MAFLTLNGITIDCSEPAGGSLSITLVGDSMRAVDGSMKIQRRVLKNKWSFTTTPQVNATALAIRDLIMGKGEYWSFDATLYSSKGTAPSSATASVFSAGSAYLGAGKLSQTASTGTITFTVLPLKAWAWTVIHARKVGSGAWHHYITCSDGSSYTDGVAAAIPGWLGVSTTPGTVTLTADASQTTLVDELVILPFLIPAAWAPQIYALNNGATQWSNLSQLNALGDAIEAAAKTVPVMGTVTKVGYVVAALAPGAPLPTSQTVGFDLDEV